MLTKKDIVALQRIRDLLEFDPTQVGFNNIHNNPRDPLPKKESEVTEFIQRRTRLLLSNYVLPVLDELIERGYRK